MRRLIPLKFFSRLLILVLLSVTINGVHESAHALQGSVTVADDQDLHSEISAPHHCPCAPLDQHTDFDDCDTCVNCVCHAPLTVQPFQLHYNPSVSDLNTSELFKHLPEVYLSRFIPPQIHV